MIVPHDGQYTKETRPPPVGSGGVARAESDIRVRAAQGFKAAAANGVRLITLNVQKVPEGKSGKDIAVMLAKDAGA